jgi:general secretion pathway protein E
VKPDFRAWGHAAASRHRAVPARDACGQLWLLADRDADTLLLQSVEHQAGTAVRWQRCSAEEVDGWLAASERDFRALDDVAEGPIEGGAGDTTAELSVAQMAAQSSPAVRLLDAVIYDALKDSASDIHFENHARGVEVRLRIDGVLLSLRNIEGAALAEQLVSRLKVMAELDIG